MTRRSLFDPMTAPLDQRAHRLGAQDPRDVNRRQAKSDRFHDTPVLQARAIGFRAPIAGGDQAVTTTTYTLITGSSFPISLAGPNDASWVISLRYRLTIQSMGAIDQQVIARILVDWHDEGIWDTAAEIDLSTDQGLIRAFSMPDFAEAAVTGAAFTLTPTLTASVRGGDTIRFGLGVAVGSGTATVNLTTTTRLPQCEGSAVPSMTM